MSLTEQRPHSNSVMQAYIPSGREIGTLITIYLFFFLINYLTASQYPVVWLDEVMFVDPAANLFLGHGFNSSTWPFQDHDKLFAGYTPLYSLLLSAWMHISGIQPAGLRSLNYLLTILTSLSIYLIVVRKQWVRGSGYRVLLVSIILLSYGISMSFRGNRPDILMMLLVSSAVLASTISNTSMRRACMFIAAFLFPIAGVQLLLFVGTSTLLLYAFLRKKFIADFFTINFGMLFGLITLLSVYALNGVLFDFYTAIHDHASATNFFIALLHGHFEHQNTIPKDLSFLVLFPAAAFLYLRSRAQLDLQTLPILKYALAACVTIAVTMLVIGKFPTYYNWMIYVPMAVATVAVASELNTPVRSFVVASLLAACLVGLPFQLAMISSDWKDRDYDNITSTINVQIRPTDHVLTDYGAYYAVLNITRDIYGPHYSKRLTAEEKSNLSVIIGGDEFFAHVQAIVGGNWKAVAEITPQQPFLTEKLLGKTIKFGMFDRKYDLKIYRRI